MEDNKGTGLEDQNLGTGNGNPGTDENNSGAASQNDDTKEIVRQRDRNYEEARQAKSEVAELAARLDSYELEKDKKEFLDGLAAKYPGVDREILDFATDPESAETLAKKFASLKESAKQDALAELQAVEDPRLDPETASERLKALEGTGNLEEMFNIKLNTKR